MGKLYTTDDITVDGNGIIKNAEITTATVTGSAIFSGPLLKEDITTSSVNLTTIQEISTAESFPETLLANTTYVVRGILLVTNSIVVSNPGCSIVGLDKERDGLLFAGKGTFITVKNQSFTLDNLRISASPTNYESFIQGSNMSEEGPVPVVGNDDPYLRNQTISVTNCLFSNINANTIFDLRGFELIVFRGNVFKNIYSQFVGLLFRDTLKLIIDSCSLYNFVNNESVSIGSLISLIKSKVRLGESAPGFGDVMISNCIVTPIDNQVGLSIDSLVPTVSGSIIGNNFYGYNLKEGRNTNIENFNEGSLVSYTSSGNIALVDGNPYCSIMLSSGDNEGSLVPVPLQAFGFIATEVQKFDFKTDRGQFFNLSLNSAVLNSQKVFISANFNIVLKEETGNKEDYANFYIAKNGIIIDSSLVKVPIFTEIPVNFNLTAMTSLSRGSSEEQPTIEIFYTTTFVSERGGAGIALKNGNINVMSI